MKEDNPFRQKLHTHTMPVREEVWEAIEKRLPPKEESRKMPFFWAILFISTLLGGSLMLGFLHKQNTSETPAAPPADHSLSANTPASTSASYPVSNDPSVTSSGSATSENAVSLSGSANSATEAGTTATSSTTPSALKRHQPQANAHKTTSGFSPRSVTASPTDVRPAGTETGSSLPMENNLQDLIAYSRSTYATPFLPLTVMDQLKAGATLKKKTMKRIKPDPNCYKFSPKGGRYFFSVDAFAGPGFSPRSFSENGGESPFYMQARKTTERNQYAWSAGARFNMHLHNGVSIRLGLLYDQAGDIFDYTDTLATQSTTRIDSFFSADGTFLYADTNRVLIFGTLIKKIHNTYRHLDVPILFGYEIPMGRSTLMINAGPVFNLTTSYEGQILDPMLHPRHITPGEQGVLSAYKTSVGLSLYLGAGALFPLTDHLAALVEPRLLYRVKPVTIKSYPLEEHRHFAGLNLGLRYFFE